MKPYAVSVRIGEKVSGKEFDTAAELVEFLQKAEELKKKAPTLSVKIVRNGTIPKPKLDSTAPTYTVIPDYNKEESLCWVKVYRDGVPMVDYKNRQLYKCVPVPRKPNAMYCPYCNAYKQWIHLRLDYGLEIYGCETCGISDQDFNVKTANNLWRTMK